MSTEQLMWLAIGIAIGAVVIPRTPLARFVP